MQYDLSQLNDFQKKAVLSTESPLLVIASAGSGKTKMLVDRTIYMIAEKGVAPENILVSTFTEKAAKELITRISNKLLELNIAVNINEMFIGTLHSIFLRILEEYRDFTRLKRNYRMLDQFDQQYFVYQNIGKFEKIDNFSSLIKNEQSRWDKSNELIYYINKVTEENIDIDRMLKSNDISIVTLAGICQTYYKALEEENSIDFSSIQTEIYKLIAENPNVLSEIQNKISYLMIDEYNDTNTIQEMILLKFAEKHKRICVVGDDDQSLYRFRGATVRNILEFPDNFKDKECKTITLSTNYRSHPDIINFSNKWMEENNWEYDGKTFRYEKSVVPRDSKFTDNPSVIKVSADGEIENWYEEVYQFITALKKNNKLADYNQIAFIFKSVKNEKVVGLANYLEDKGIFVFSPRSNMVFNREEIRLLIGAFVFMFPQFPEIRKWNKDAHLTEWDYYDNCFQEFCDKLRLPENRDLKNFCAKKALAHKNLTENTDWNYSVLFYQLLEFPLFSKYIDIDLNSRVYDVRPAYNLGLFSNLINKFEYLQNISVFTVKNLNNSIISFFNQYFRFLMDGGISEYEEFDEYAPAGCVSFLTVHQSKGLEFPIVFVDSLNDIPRKQYDDIDLILQQNYYNKLPFEPIEMVKFFDFYRLYYVAFSRAQNLLVLSCNENQEGRGQAKTPSKYFEKMYNSLISWRDERFDIEKLAFETIKEVNIKKEYSFTSHILLFENCAMQYKYFKELEFTPVRKGSIIFGVLVHQTIEDIHKRVLRKEEDKITTENIENWFNTNYNLLSKSSRTYLAEVVKKSALNQVLTYYERNKSSMDKIVDAEVDVSLVKDLYILKGTIDLIQGENNTVKIIDFKSQNKPDVNNPKEREILERYKRQLEIYSHIVEERTGKTVSEMNLYYTSETEGVPIISFPKSQSSIDKTIKVFDGVVERIENKDFKIKERPEKKVCKECDMRHFCNKKFDVYYE